MAANSKHKIDVFTWILKVIDSCETYNQLITCKKLSGLFLKKYSDSYLFRKLRNEIDDKYYILKDGKKDN